MTLLWAVPVVAAAVAATIMAVGARPIGDELSGLVRDARRLRELRAPLEAVRAQVRDSEALGVAYRNRHARDDGDASTAD